MKTAFEKLNSRPTFILNGQNLTHFEFLTTNRPQFNKRFQIVSNIMNKPKAGMEQDLHLLCLIAKASRANEVLGRLADKEIAWQRSLLPQAQALKAEFLEKYGDHERVLSRLRQELENAYDESYEKGVICTLAIRLTKHIEPKHESHVLVFKDLQERAKSKRAKQNPAKRKSVKQKLAK